MAALDQADVVAFAEPAGWESWLAANHDRSAGIWLRIAKKHSGVPSVSLAEALDVALCHGWIDSHRRGLDATHYLQRYSPRRAGSAWSRVNVDKAEALIAAGRMREGGFAAIRAARADGRWEAAYASQRDAMVPADLAAAFAGDEQARERFDVLGRTDRYALMLPLMKARSPRARAAQLERIMAELGRSA